jgi:hypothetical protein
MRRRRDGLVGNGSWQISRPACARAVLQGRGVGSSRGKQRMLCRRSFSDSRRSGKFRSVTIRVLRHEGGKCLGLPVTSSSRARRARIREKYRRPDRSTPCASPWASTKGLSRGRFAVWRQRLHRPARTGAAGSLLRIRYKHLADAHSNHPGRDHQQYRCRRPLEVATTQRRGHLCHVGVSTTRIMNPALPGRGYLRVDLI